MSEVLTRYQWVLAELEELLTYGMCLIQAQVGHEPVDEHQFYAERTFGKLLCHGLTLKRISPSPIQPSSGELWDISSQYAVARCLIESFEALAYIAFEDISTEERTFRLSLWKLHAEERRLRMLQLVRSINPAVSDVAANVAALRDNILCLPFLQRVGGNLQQRIQRGQTPPFHLTNAQRDQRNCINNDYHQAVTMHLSSHVHTHPFSVFQLHNFRAGDDECLRLMSIAVQYSTGFLAKGINGMIKLFSPRVPEITAGLLEMLGRWQWVLEQGVHMDN